MYHNVRWNYIFVVCNNDKEELILNSSDDSPFQKISHIYS